MNSVKEIRVSENRTKKIPKTYAHLKIEFPLIPREVPKDKQDTIK